MAYGIRWAIICVRRAFINVRAAVFALPSLVTNASGFVPGFALAAIIANFLARASIELAESPDVVVTTIAIMRDGIASTTILTKAILTVQAFACRRAFTRVRVFC